MAKKATKKKPAKKRATKYDEKLKINMPFEEAMKLTYKKKST